MGITDDRRRNPRVRVKVRIEVRDVETGRAHVLHTSNLSVGGASCTALSPVREGATLEGLILLPLTEAGRDMDVALPVRARVVRTCMGSAASELGIAFDVMPEADRAELSAYLFDWLADDSLSHGSAMAGAVR